MAENDAPRGVQIGIDSIAKHIAAPARDCGIPEQYDEIVRRAKDALTIRADQAAPDAAQLKDAIKAIAAPKAETIAKGVRELGLASFGTEGASKAQFFIETQLLDFLQAVDCLRLLHTDVSPDAVRQARREMDNALAKLRAHEEAEASVCPEDVSCIEYIKYLKQKLGVDA